MSDEKIDENDEHGGGNDGLGCRLPNTARSTGCFQAVIATDGRDNKAREEGLHEATNYVAGDQGHVGGVEVGLTVELQEIDGDETSAGRPTGVGDDGEEEEHEDGGDEARGDELADGIGSQGTHGVDLLGHFHGAEFAGHA